MFYVSECLSWTFEMKEKILVNSQTNDQKFITYVSAFSYTQN